MLEPRYGACFAALLVVAAAATPALAQGSWPQSTVKIIVPYPPGGGADGLPRVLTDALSKKWGQPVVIENKAGAGGNVGAEVAARAAPDGYTILSAPTPVYTANPVLYKKMNFDVSSLKPIVTLGEAASVLVVHPSVAKSLKEFMEKAKTTEFAYGSQGNGSTSHLTAAMFENAAGIKMRHVPYRGSGPMMNDLVGGHIALTFDNFASALVQHKAGKAIILAVCSEKRSPFVPEIPTMIESGLPGFVSVARFAMTAPAGTPDDIIAKINKDVVELLKTDEVKAKYAGLGAIPVADTPQEMGASLVKERDRWANVIKTSNIPQID